ncbi:MAG: purine-nucleoside phosphorylase [Coriobacteriia bacterium]
MSEIPAEPLEGLHAEIALILGSGFAAVAEKIADARAVPFAEIPGFPPARAHVAGHPGRLIVGELGGRRVVAFQGRLHAYQGYSAAEVAFPVRLAAGLGARLLVVTNASGAVNPEIDRGEMVLISDQLNLTGDSPLVLRDREGAAREGAVSFVPMRDAYDPELRTAALVSASEAGVPVRSEGVYAGVLGPAYETQAEVAMLRTLGADLVGMSTVHEVIAARSLGMRVLGLSLVTNVAAGEGLTHAEVLEAGRRASAQADVLLPAILQRLPDTQ